MTPISLTAAPVAIDFSQIAPTTESGWRTADTFASSTTGRFAELMHRVESRRDGDGPVSESPARSYLGRERQGDGRAWDARETRRDQSDKATTWQMHPDKEVLRESTEDVGVENIVASPLSVTWAGTPQMDGGAEQVDEMVSPLAAAKDTPGKVPSVSENGATAELGPTVASGLPESTNEALPTQLRLWKEGNTAIGSAPATFGESTGSAETPVLPPSGSGTFGVGNALAGGEFTETTPATNEANFASPASATNSLPLESTITSGAADDSEAVVSFGDNEMADFNGRNLGQAMESAWTEGGENKMPGAVDPSVLDGSADPTNKDVQLRPTVRVDRLGNAGQNGGELPNAAPPSQVDRTMRMRSSRVESVDPGTVMEFTPSVEHASATPVAKGVEGASVMGRVEQMQSGVPPTTPLARDSSTPAAVAESVTTAGRNGGVRTSNASSPTFSTSEPTSSATNVSRGNEPRFTGPETRPTPSLAEQLRTQLGAEIITESRLMKRPGHTEFEMRLDPPELGRVLVRLEDRHDRLTVQLHASDQAVREVLNGQLDQLRNSLQQAGVNIDGFQLSDGGRGGAEQNAFQRRTPAANVRGGESADYGTDARGRDVQDRRYRINIVA
ncbi:MAG: flagellar hook-length control protein FliK [Pirellulaceae bacterium]